MHPSNGKLGQCQSTIACAAETASWPSTLVGLAANAVMSRRGTRGLLHPHIDDITRHSGQVREGPDGDINNDRATKFAINTVIPITGNATNYISDTVYILALVLPPSSYPANLPRRRRRPFSKLIIRKLCIVQNHRSFR